MEQKGSKTVELAGLNDKCQTTLVFCASLTGEFLPVQVVYQGKTTASLPRYAFPDDWDITFTPNHWSNEDKTMEYINNIIIPYVQRKRKDLKVSPSHSALAIYDEFKGNSLLISSPCWRKIIYLLLKFLQIVPIVFNQWTCR